MKPTPADEQLLSLLRENARLSTAEIARRLKLSRTTVHSRIERLERQGVIDILIAVMPRQMPAVVKALRGIPEVRTLHSVSGASDLVALGATSTVEDMDVLTDRIGAIDGVERTTSSIILSTKFSR